MTAHTVLRCVLVCQASCSRTLAAWVEAILRPMYTFWVTDGWACPSWSAMVRADSPALSSRVAVVLAEDVAGDPWQSAPGEALAQVRLKPTTSTRRADEVVVAATATSRLSDGFVAGDRDAHDDGCGAHLDAQLLGGLADAAVQLAGDRMVELDLEARAS